MNDSQKKNHHSSEIPWFVIIVAFALFWPVGLGLLIYKLGQEGQSSENRQKWSDALLDFKDDVNVITNSFKEDFQREFNRSREAGEKHRYRPVYGYRWPDDRETTAEEQSKKGKKKKKKKDDSEYSRAYRSAEYEDMEQSEKKKKKAQTLKNRLAKIKDGKLFTVLGAIITLIFGIGAIDEAFFWLPNYPILALQNAIAPFVFAGVGAGMFVWGRFKNRQARRFRKLLNLIGDNEHVDIRTLAEAMPCSYDRACDMLQNMIDAGYLGEKAYIDMSTGYLVLDGRGVESRTPPPEPQTPEEERRNDESVLQEIRRVNESIPDPTLSRKIDRIEEITGHILDYQKKHPDKASDLHKFLNYYLPTTLKILNTYAELDQQGIGGDNINATKERIEGMMDLVVEGFEKQLDKLFEGDMMDISSDISVMEKMLSHDGLAGGMKIPRAPEVPTEPKQSAKDGIHLTLEPEGDTISEPAPSAGGIHLTLNPDGNSAAAPAPQESWADGFYRRTKEDLK